MLGMSYLDYSHFSDWFGYIICRIVIYGFVDMNYLILNEKGKINKIYFIFIWIKDYYYLFIVVYSNNYMKCKKIKTSNIIV